MYQCTTYPSSCLSLFDGLFEPSARPQPIIFLTAQYMSPEMASKKEYDLQTDMWSLGVLLYFLLSGQEPFNGMLCLVGGWINQRK